MIDGHESPSLSSILCGPLCFLLKGYGQHPFHLVGIGATLVVKYLDQDITPDSKHTIEIRRHTRRHPVANQRKEGFAKNNKKGIKKLPEARSSYLSVWWNKSCLVIQLGEQ